MSSAYDALTRGFAGCPDRTALETPAGERLSFRELGERALWMAGLLEQLGLERGARLVAQVPKCPDAVCLYLACLRAGVVYVPVNPAATASELEQVLADAEPVAVVVDPGIHAAASGLASSHRVPQVLTLGTDGGGDLPARCRCVDRSITRPPPGPDDLAAIVYTSGTTGRPKGAMLTHGNLVANALVLVQAWRFTAQDVLLHVLPLTHVHGLFVALHCALLVTARVWLIPAFHAAETASRLRQATVFMGVPTHYVRMLAQPGLDRDSCAGMRLFVSGSAPLAAPVSAAFEARTGHRILERYGMTETLMIAGNPYDERVPGSVGLPLCGVATRILREDGAPAGTGETGMLEVSSPSVFRGYWRAREQTRASLREDGYFVTGDLAAVDERGYLWLRGRASELVITGGYNVHPREVESVLEALPGVEEAAVFGVPHPDLGEAVVAVLRGAGVQSEDEVIATCRERLSSYKLPRRVLWLDEIPRNAMGKVQRRRLSDAHLALFRGTGE